MRDVKPLNVTPQAIRRVTFRSALSALPIALAMVACNGGSPTVSRQSNANGVGGNGGSNQNTVSGINVGEGGSTNPAGGAGSTNPAENAVCGDGKRASSEACDDFNTNANDGCAADCKAVELGFVCPNPGEKCIAAQTCGDKKISGTENCDDGNAQAGDGCSETCRTETGWSCLFVGARCVAAACGDGILAGQESCDDGQNPPVAGDGCSENCTVESPTDTERVGWSCPKPGQACVRTTCGDGTAEGTEQCDDGNNDTADLCSPFCRKEPSCPPEGGACKSVCGDGMILPTDTDQECDDGNLVANDGCSPTCTVEKGYACLAERVVPSGTLNLPVVYRDFKGGTDIANGQHPDFEHGSGKFEAGIVEEKLGLDGKPIHVAADMTTTTNNDAATTPDWFSIWYRDAVAELPTAGSPRYNYTFVDALTLTETAANSGAFQFSDTSFYPLTGRKPSWGNTTGRTQNYHFTSEVRYWFQYAGNELLTFSGDDDVWVFVNKRLAVDLGGIHVAEKGSVMLHESDGTGLVCERDDPGCATPKPVDFGLEIGKVYEIVVFQAERHTTESNYTLTLSAFAATRSRCTSVCGDGIVTPDEACDLGKENNTGEYGTCTSDCKLPAYCGDGHVDVNGGEDCDDGVNLSTYGYNGERACGPSCKWTHTCGDGNLDNLYGEECDDGNRKSGDDCEANCTHRRGCGNGKLDAGEACDDGNLKSGDGCSEFCTNDILM
jgi:fibro-slime domain-containing protein